MKGTNALNGESLCISRRWIGSEDDDDCLTLFRNLFLLYEQLEEDFNKEEENETNIRDESFLERYERKKKSNNEEYNKQLDLLFSDVK